MSAHQLMIGYFMSMTCLQLLSESAQVGVAEGVELHSQLKNLVEYIWAEATGELEEVGTASKFNVWITVSNFHFCSCQVLSVSVEHIKLEQVDKAEAALLSLRRLLDQGADPQSQGTVTIPLHHLSEAAGTSTCIQYICRK